MSVSANGTISINIQGDSMEDCYEPTTHLRHRCCLQRTTVITGPTKIWSLNVSNCIVTIKTEILFNTEFNVFSSFDVEHMNILVLIGRVHFSDDVWLLTSDIVTLDHLGLAVFCKKL